MAVCTTIGMYGNPNWQWISWAMNYGLAYNLPNETFNYANMDLMTPEMPAPVMMRRNRRELYQKLEGAMNT
jgi:hypothetical protein